MNYHDELSRFMGGVQEIRRDIQTKLLAERFDIPNSTVYCGPKTLRLSFRPIYSYKTLMKMKALAEGLFYIISETSDGVWIFHIYLHGPGNTSPVTDWEERKSA